MTEQARPPGIHTRAVHGSDPDPGANMSTPVVHSSTFASPSLDAMIQEERRGPAGSFYQRIGHPTLSAVERRLADLEGAEQGLLPAIWNPATASGAAMLNAEVTRQAAAIGYANDFWLMMVLTLCAMPLVLLMHSGRHDTGSSASDAAAAAH